MTKNFLFLFAILCIGLCIYQQDRYCLINSLAVGGKNDKILDWTCKSCNKQFQPTSQKIKNKTEHNIRIVEGYSQRWLKNQFTQDFKAIISLYDDFIVLAFKFTDNIPKLIVDLKAFQKRIDPYYPNCHNCKVHQGFYRLWTTNKINVFNSLREILKIGQQIQKLYITGISLGGALAVISYLDIKQQFSKFTNIQITTFGAPKVGNQQFANYFDQSTSNQSKRYVVKNDPIPNLPPKILGNYKQTGSQYFCETKKKICKQLLIDQQANQTESHNDQKLLQNLMNMQMFSPSICKNDKNQRHFLRKRSFQQHFSSEHQKQKYENHQNQKHESVINHICDYPKILNFTNVLLGQMTQTQNIESIPISFTQQYKEMLAHSLGVFSWNNMIENWTFPYSQKCSKPSKITIIERNQTGFKAMITTFLKQPDNNNHIVLTFRGSQNDKNWESNYLKNFIQYQNCGIKEKCEVHEGFYQLWKANRDQVINNLLQIQKEQKISKIYITGISLGGALSQLSLIDIVHNMASNNITKNLALNISVVTFGAPRVGDKNWVKAYENISTIKISVTITKRFILQKDPVPFVPCYPGKIPIQKYFHTGVEEKCNQKNCVQVKSDDKKCIFSGAPLLQMQIKQILKVIKDQCLNDVVKYCNSATENSGCKIVHSDLEDYDFNVHVCNYPKLFSI